MGDALLQLEQILQAKQLTNQEANVLWKWKVEAVTDWAASTVFGGCLTWLATQRLSNIPRFILSGGAAALSGSWSFNKSIDLGVKHILSLNGTRMQRELADIMLKKPHADQQKYLHLMSKHFYSERVYVDSSPDQLKLRLRYRTFSGDNVDHSEREHESFNNDDKADLQTKQVFASKQVKSAVDAMADPFACVFGPPQGVEEIPRPDSPGKSPRRQSRSHKRSRRRHRMHEREVSSSPDMP